MILKVCGLTELGNVLDLTEVEPDLMGLIFYEKSSRYVKSLKMEKTIDRVGVFVNESIDIIKEKVEMYELDFVQLHGNETPSFCKEICQTGVGVIKAFSVDDEFSFNSLTPYTDYCKYFLFDTKGKLPGGNGVRFNWEKLKEYGLEVPFLLSGGIELNHASEISKLYKEMEQMVGVDINSRFEIKPGLKDVNKVKEFKKLINENPN